MLKVLLTSDTHRGFTQGTSRIHDKWAKRDLLQKDYDIMVLAGDIATHKQIQVHQALKFFRGVAGNKPILWCRGNHDYWADRDNNDKKTKSVEDTLKDHREWAAKFNVHLIDEGSFEYQGVFFGGFFTWYKDPGMSNDPNFILPFAFGQRTDDLFLSLEKQSLQHLSEELYNRVGQTRVVISHMPCVGAPFDQKYTTNFSNFNALAWNCEHYMFGHSHELWAGRELSGVKCYQSGSDYDKPKSLLIEV